jgi:hypothetical protein
MVDYTKFTVTQLKEILSDKEQKLYTLTFIEKLNNELEEIETIKQLIELKESGN